MGKVFGIHKIVLNPGVDEKEFEKFMAEAMPQTVWFEGWKVHFCKGDRGEGIGEYVLLYELESVEARNRYSPAPNTNSEEAEGFSESLTEEQRKASQTIGEKFATFSSADLNAIYTDWVSIASSK